MNQERWTVSKVINLGDILTISAALVAIAIAWNDIDKRVEKNTQSIKFLEQQRLEDVKRVEKRLDSIDRKLDRLLADK